MKKWLGSILYLVIPRDVPENGELPYDWFEIILVYFFLGCIIFMLLFFES